MKSILVAVLSSLLFHVYGDEQDTGEFTGGWMPASLDDSMKYYSNLCNIPKIPAADMNEARFEKEFKDKPFILTFPNGQSDWVKAEFWTLQNLTGEYQEWKLSAGKSIDIVYNGGRGDFNRTFDEFVKEMRTKVVPGGDLTYLFDRNFYYNSSLPSTISVPEYLFSEGDPILFIGPSGTGATWHKHMPAWNGVVFGQKRWFLYPIEKSPPGGLYSYHPSAWVKYVYPKLKAEDKPMECIQNAGEIFYVPESYYHAILNIGETVAISIQSKNVTTSVENEFYRAMEDHYKATTLEEENLITTHYELADKRYTDLHFLYPYNTDIMAHLGEIACERGDTRRCERILNHIVNLDPFNIESLKLRSRIYYDRNEYVKSENDVINGLKIHPFSKGLLREHANFLWNVRKQESKKAYEKLLSVLDPETTEAEGIRDLIDITDFGPNREVVGPPSPPTREDRDEL